MSSLPAVTTLTKATFTSSEGGVTLTVPFNPESFSVERSVTWNDNAAQKVAFAGLSFGHGDNDTLEMTLLLDETEGATFGAQNSLSVLTTAQVFHTMTLPKVPEGTTMRPPVVTFTWEQVRFTGVIVHVRIDFRLFAPTGQPKRALVSLKMSGQAFQAAATADAVLNPSSTVSSGGGGGGGAPPYSGM